MNSYRQCWLDYSCFGGRKMVHNQQTQLGQNGDSRPPTHEIARNLGLPAVPQQSPTDKGIADR